MTRHLRRGRKGKGKGIIKVMVAEMQQEVRPVRRYKTGDVVKCANCGKQIKLNAGRTTKLNCGYRLNSFCSRECQSSFYSRLVKVEFICANCGNKGFSTKGELNKRLKRNVSGKFYCSKKCTDASFKFGHLRFIKSGSKRILLIPFSRWDKNFPYVNISVDRIAKQVIITGSMKRSKSGTKKLIFNETDSCYVLSLLPGIVERVEIVNEDIFQSGVTCVLQLYDEGTLSLFEVWANGRGSIDQPNALVTRLYKYDKYNEGERFELSLASHLIDTDKSHFCLLERRGRAILIRLLPARIKGAFKLRHHHARLLINAVTFYKANQDLSLLGEWFLDRKMRDGTLVFRPLIKDSFVESRVIEKAVNTRKINKLTKIDNDYIEPNTETETLSFADWFDDDAEVEKE